MFIDALKTCYIEGLPALKYQEFSKVFSPIGPSVNFVLKSDEDNSSCAVLTQFRTAAQVKVALDILPQVKIQRLENGPTSNLTVVISEETKEWIRKTAPNASSQSLTRMPPATLIAKVESQLDAVIRQEERSENTKISQTEPDGTLDSNFADAELYKKDVLEFRRETARVQEEQEAQRAGLIERSRDKIKLEMFNQNPKVVDEDFEKFDERDSALHLKAVWEDVVNQVNLWAQDIHERHQKLLEIQADRESRAEKELKQVKRDAIFTGDLRELQARCAQEREADDLDELMEVESSAHNPKVPEETEEVVVQSKKDIDWTLITSDLIQVRVKPEIEKEVENIFGEADESVVQFVVDLLEAQTPPDQLATELEGPLGEDAASFTETLINLLIKI